MPQKAKSDTYIVYRLLKKELTDYKFKLEENEAEPELATIWVESDVMATYMTLEDKSLWITDDCQDHLECDNNQCEPGCFVLKLADPEFIERVDGILWGIGIRRTAIDTIKKDPFAIEDRDMRISQLEALLKKNKIRIPK